MRISDMRKLVDGASQELVNLSRCAFAAAAVAVSSSSSMYSCIDAVCFVCSLAEVINVKILEDIFRNVEGNTKQLVDAGAVGERSAISLGIIQVRFASPPPSSH